MLITEGFDFAVALIGENMKYRWAILITYAILGLFFIYTINTLAAPNNSLQVSFIDVGQGDSALFQDSSGFDVLIDGGRTSRLVELSLRVKVSEGPIIGAQAGHRLQALTGKGSLLCQASAEIPYRACFQIDN